MPRLSLEDRGRAVGLVNVGTPKQRTRDIFCISIIFLCTDRYMHNIVSLTFNCTRHVCFTDTTRLLSNCGRRIWQPGTTPRY